MTLEKQKWTNCFNEKFIEFINELIETFPDDKDFKLFKSSYNMMKMMNDNAPIEIFRAHAMEYRDKIIEEDGTFFLKHNFQKEMAMSNLGGEYGNHVNFSTDLLQKLKKYWVDLSNDNKAIIWKYLKLLYKINDKI